MVARGWLARFAGRLPVMLGRCLGTCRCSLLLLLLLRLLLLLLLPLRLLLLLRLALDLAFGFWLSAFDLSSRKASRASQGGRAKSSPCLSAASLGCVTVKVTMCPVAREAQGPPRLHAADRVRRTDFLVPFGPSKRNSHAQRAKAVHLLCFPPFAAFARIQLIREEQSFRAVRAAYFCLVKSKHDSADALANGEAGPKGECRRCESNRHRRTRADAAAPHRSPARLA